MATKAKLNVGKFKAKKIEPEKVRVGRYVVAAFPDKEPQRGVVVKHDSANETLRVMFVEGRDAEFRNITIKQIVRVGGYIRKASGRSAND